jgi:hypothetical protein
VSALDSEQQWAIGVIGQTLAFRNEGTAVSIVFRAQKIAPILLFSTILTGCLPDKEQDLAACEVEAMRIFAKSPDVGGNPHNKFIRSCMRAKGYRLTLSKSEDCITGMLEFPISKQSDCYSGRLDRLLGN